MAARTMLGSLLIVLGILQLVAVPGYYSPGAGLVAFGVGAFLVLLGYVVVPETSVDAF